MEKKKLFLVCVKFLKIFMAFVFSIFLIFCLFSCGGSGGGMGGNDRLGEKFEKMNGLKSNSIKVTALNIAKTQINAKTLQTLQNSGYNFCWLLEWYNQNNQKCSKIFPFNTEQFELVLQNGNARPILLHLLVNEKKYFYPAGAVFPNMAQISESQNQNGQNIKIKLDFINGICADVLFDILQKNFNNSSEAENYCNYFNWQKLAESIAKKKKPAFVDRILIAEKICANDFSASCIKEKKTFKAKLPKNSSINCLICKDLQKEPLEFSNFLEILKENADYLSDKGFVFLQYVSDNSLIITSTF